MDDRGVARRTVLVGGSPLLGLGIAGCLGDEGDEHALGNPEPYVEVRTTSEGGGRFDPGVVHLVRGGTVEWVPEEGVHDVVAYHPDTHGPRSRTPTATEPWASGSLQGGESYDHEFETEGVYDYTCVRHEEGGMAGTVVVGWPEPEGQPALEPASRELPDAAAESTDRQSDRVRELLEEEHGRE